MLLYNTVFLRAAEPWTCLIIWKREKEKSCYSIHLDSGFTSHLCTHTWHKIWSCSHWSSWSYNSFIHSCSVSSLSWSVYGWIQNPRILGWNTPGQQSILGTINRSHSTCRHVFGRRPWGKLTQTRREHVKQPVSQSQDWTWNPGAVRQKRYVEPLHLPANTYYK